MSAFPTLWARIEPHRATGVLLLKPVETRMPAASVEQVTGGA